MRPARPPASEGLPSNRRGRPASAPQLRAVARLGRRGGKIAALRSGGITPGHAGPWAALLLHAVGAGPCQRIIDVACGIGTEARAAMDRVQPIGCVVGVDDCDAAVAFARRRGATGADIRRGGRARPPDHRR